LSGRLPATLSLRLGLAALAAALIGIVAAVFWPEPAPSPVPDIAVPAAPALPVAASPPLVETRTVPDVPDAPGVAERADDPAGTAEPVAVIPAQGAAETGPATPLPEPAPVAEPAPPAVPAPAAPSRAEQLAALADAALADGRLLDPPEDNAFEYVRALDELAPGAPGTDRRTTRLIDLMLIEAMVSISEQAFADADRWIAGTRELGATEKSLRRFETELQKARDAVEARKKESLGAIFASATPAAILASPEIDYDAEDPSAPPRPAVETRTDETGQTALVGGSFALAMTPGALPMIETPAVAERPAKPAEQRQDIALSALEFKRFVEPEIPRRASVRNTTGWVELRFRISTSGRTEAIEVIDSAPDDRFDELALDAVSKWRFEPVYVDGVPTEKFSSVRLRFEPR
jgi:protein TonB